MLRELTFKAAQAFRGACIRAGWWPSIFHSPSQAVIGRCGCSDCTDPKLRAERKQALAAYHVALDRAIAAEGGYGGLFISGPGCPHLPLEGVSTEVNRSCVDCDDFVDECTGYGMCERCHRRGFEGEPFRFRQSRAMPGTVKLYCAKSCDLDA